MKQGFVVILATLLVLSAGLVIVLSAGYISLSSVKVIRNNIYSAQAYYTAEAGIEDSLLRLNKNLNFSKTNSFTVGDGTATIEIADLIGGSRTIISSGDVSNRVRKVRIIRAMTTEKISFYYGAQAGDGGIYMEPNSVIHGNVFSNGTVEGEDKTVTIDNSLIVAKSGNKIINLTVGTAGNIPPDEARAHTCAGSTINGDLYYVSGGGYKSGDCTVSGGGEKEVPNAIEPANMPISDSQIGGWKNEAVGGGIIFGDYTVSGGVTEYLGPEEIDGNLIIENNAVLILTGTLWITGSITISNGATVRLGDRYGSTSGIIVADGKIMVENGVILEGSGLEGSYIMLLTTNDSTALADPAIYVKNNAEGAIFYASVGMIRLRNNINIREATGWKLHLDNNAEITYESGLISSLFSSGPAGSWQITEWKEVE